MSKKINAIRGMNDLVGDASVAYDYLMATAEAVLKQYGFQSIRLPLVEKTELFARSIGEVTDIVEKEMYTFADRNGDSLTLRPEGTAGCVRAVIENGLTHNQIQKLYYAGPMFRHERPQKGRYRQFNQIGVEVFGLETVDADAELIAMTARLWESLGLTGLVLQINSLGSQQARQAYRVLLVDYLEGHQAHLDEDSLRRLKTNPLRILDSKNPDMAEIIAGAPKLIEHLDDVSKQHYEDLKAHLEDLGILYEENPNLVRGLDYYNRTVFEWVTTELGAQGTVCAGGRYDGLVEQIGGKPTPAVGFAMGMERLAVLLMDKGLIPTVAAADIYMVLAGEATKRPGLVISEQIRENFPQLKVQMNCGGGSFKSQFKKADKSGAQLALVLGEDEVAQQQLVVKYLRENREQLVINWSDLTAHLANQFSSAVVESR
ncbi:MAG: histidine--tRNA ligase [Piscirickettsiaceae bacterium CG_4_9_14_3_um_filter_43_564]|nr:histidine--tRNA ligase [Thiomicrospira sp.]OIP95626.1 MAG: histidine--tRNA ligase [Thiomicrospira sp. CG2_30_44_34]PIQ04565.1 MAG: histidine--tRNA ligase [Piscirickettsiaceae bacterium CG18_big_fil_WC_8_21_14_2_50_44_103]PIU39284.1 MAG: histidine--tRNA ligase [Piscirickettsiaceae bacterium CG07_land_8_20_14_0_80_44_28]PIW57810.1 MAG: histidine--tRNA ligase [Piscirickettsiaceae bacterium CG12_big_fil_rev_8_21_14_0_65_44_934]PIW78504.1 MAG: histidine--tRNA ligase [Piscirickettsiaceae bacteriu